MLRSPMLARSAALALAVLLVACSTSEAQRGGRGFGRGFGGVSKSQLLRSEQVQKELDINEDQLAKINEINEAAREGRRGGFNFQELRDLPEEERRAKLEELRAEATKRAEETNAKIAGVLTSEQSKRLDEIILQQRGLQALTDKEVAAKLKISEDQQQQISDLFATQREMQREMFEGLRDVPREERRAKFEELNTKREELNNETEKAVMEVLTASQKSDFEKMKGKAFELDRRSLFGGRGRGGRGRGGDGNNDGGGRRRPQNRPQNTDT